MKVETIIPEQDKKRIEEYQEKIKEIVESYFDDKGVISVSYIFKLPQIVHMVKNDPLIKMYEKMIEDIYTYAIPQTFLITENDEDKKILKGLLDKNG